MLFASLHRPALGATLLVALAACRLERMPPPADPASAEATVDSVVDEVGIETGEELNSFRRDLHFDFTGDGRPEEVKIRARGTRSDALEVTLRIEDPRDSVLYSDRWSSEGYLKYVDPRTRANRRAVRGLVQTELERLVADSNLGEPVAVRIRRARESERRESIRYDVAESIWRQRQGLRPDAPIPTTALDSVDAIARANPDPERVRRLLAETAATDRYLMYFRGNEERYVLAWSAAERRFVKIWRCC